jgi:hypothetical protein
MMGHPVLPPGYREPEEEESTLSVVLDSLIPFIRGNDTNVQLPVFLGKSVIDPVLEVGRPAAHGLWWVRLGKNLRGPGVWELNTHLLKPEVQEKIHT